MAFQIQTKQDIYVLCYFKGPFDLKLQSNHQRLHNLNAFIKITYNLKHLIFNIQMFSSMNSEQIDRLTQSSFNVFNKTNKINHLFLLHFRPLNENKNGVMMIMGNNCHINSLNDLFYHKHICSITINNDSHVYTKP